MVVIITISASKLLFYHSPVPLEALSFCLFSRFFAYKGVIFKSFNKHNYNCTIRSAVCQLADKLPGQINERKGFIVAELYPVRENNSSATHHMKITVKVTEHWHALSKGCVESPSLEIFKSHLRTVLGNQF